MNKNIIAIILALLCVTGLSAQVIVEPEVQTDSIVFEQENKSDKSPTVAKLTTILIPGLGHQYLGNRGRALTYFTAEAAFIFGLIFTEQFSQKMFDDSRAYAARYAQASGGAGADEYYWKNVGSEMSSADYNTRMEQYRVPEEKYIAENLYWNWDDETRKEEYNQMREDATLLHVGSSFFLAAMVLNRAIAFIDIRRSLRYNSISRQNALKFHPHHNIASGRSGITLSGTF
ncbi:MAG: DUF6677 family protein [Fibrobacterota bacterium]